MSDLLFLVLLLAVCCLIGSILERRHYRSIEERERATVGLPLTTGKTLPVDPGRAEVVALVAGSAVVSVDYFKRFLAWLRNIFGGRVKSYEPLLDRARREAVLRMKEQTPDAHCIVNVRIETSSISKSSKRRRISCVEVVAYGTAVRFRDS
ncbi:YbjQ family protein [Desulfocurvus sp. DL9XJH121]